MYSFFACLAAIIIGYAVYGAYVSRIFAPDDRQTPAYALEDGADFVPMSEWRVFLVQLLNIAGLGPIFGAIAGAQWGPAVFLWITFGTIFAGGVHDFLVGMISVRNDGASISEIVGRYLGEGMRQLMRVFSVVLLVLIGVAFTTGPANLLSRLTGHPTNIWLAIVLVYYFVATFVPIDKVIGKIYPLFGICLVVMAVGLAIGLFAGGYEIPEITLENMHPAGTPIWPIMFISVACGAISGFHATQSPMMARCLKDERKGRQIFYGAMAAEGVIALIWAAAGVSFYDSYGALSEAIAHGGQAAVVYEICFKVMGPIGAYIAMLGVIACPITSADTSYRSARLTLADWSKMEQKSAKNRLILTVPILAAGAALTQVNFQIIWRYSSWANQTLAMIALWASAVYLYKHGKNWLIAAVPATFMSLVCPTYILMAEEGLALPTSTACPAGAAIGTACLAVFLYTCPMRKRAGESAGANRS